MGVGVEGGENPSGHFTEVASQWSQLKGGVGRRGGVEGRREKGRREEGRREKGEGRREKGEGRRVGRGRVGGEGERGEVVSEWT
jgi:hypothetical protein